MNKTLKMLLLIVIVMATLALIPCISNAAEIKVPEEKSLFDAVNQAKDGDVINITENVELTQAMVIYNDISINGNGNVVTAAEGMIAGEGKNLSMITAMPGANVTLSGITLENSPKYGVQVYDGGRAQLDGVKVANCKFGGILVNAGTIEINNLTLEANGANKDNGIEISKGKSIESSENIPSILMNGEIEAIDQANVVYLAVDENDATTEVIIENSEYTTQKMSIDGNRIVVSDYKGEILYSSNEKEGVTLSGDEYKVSYKVTLNIEGQESSVDFYVEDGTVLTADAIYAEIPFDKLGIADRTVSGYYTDAKYTTELDLTKAISADTEIFVKLSDNAEEPGNTTEKPSTEDPAKDGNNTEEEIENPQTGDNLFVYIVAGVIAIVGLGAVIKAKKSN